MALHAVAAEDAACVGHQASTGSSWVVLRVQAVLRAGSAMTASHACWWCTARGRGAGEPLEGRLVGAAAELAELAAVLQDVSDGVARTVGRIDAAGRRLRKERGERADLEAAIAARDERLAEAHCDLDDVRRHADARRRADSAIKAAKNRAARDLGSSSTPAPPPPPSDDESVYTWFAAPQSIGASRAPPAKPAAKLVAAEKLPRTVASAGRGARLARGAKGVAPPPAPGKGKRAPSATRGYTHKASAPTPSRSAKATQPRAKPAPKPAAAAEKKETREGPGAVPAPEVGADEVEACEAAVARLEEAQAQDEAALDSFVKEGVWARMAARYAQLKRSGGLVPPDPPAVKACDDDVATDGDTWAHLCAALDAQRAEGAGAASMCDAGSGYAKHAASSATEMLQLIEEYQDVAGGEGTREVWQVLLALWFSTDWFLTAGTEATQRCILREELEWVEAVGRVFPGADGDVEQKHQDVVDDYLSHLDLGDADDASGSDEDVPPTPPPQADDAWRTDCDAHPRACAASALRHAEECILRPLLDLDHGTWGTAAGDLERLALLRLGSCVLMHKALFLPPVVGTKGCTVFSAAQSSVMRNPRPGTRVMTQGAVSSMDGTLIPAGTEGCVWEVRRAPRITICVHVGGVPKLAEVTRADVKLGWHVLPAGTPVYRVSSDGSGGVVKGGSGTVQAFHRKRNEYAVVFLKLQRVEAVAAREVLLVGDGRRASRTPGLIHKLKSKLRGFFDRSPSPGVAVSRTCSVGSDLPISNLRKVPTYSCLASSPLSRRSTAPLPSSHKKHKIVSLSPKSVPVSPDARPSSPMRLRPAAAQRTSAQSPQLLLNGPLFLPPSSLSQSSDCDTSAPSFSTMASLISMRHDLREQSDYGL